MNEKTSWDYDPKWLLNPKTRTEQVDGVIHFYYTFAQINAVGADKRYKLLRMLAEDLFLNSECAGYRAFVVRSALKDLKESKMEWEAPPYQLTD